MSIAIYPGSFDPVTLGHLDIIERAANISEELIVAVLMNSSKSPLFSVEERVNMLREVTKHIDNVKIMSFSGLLVNFARDVNANIIVRGLRAITDFEYELQMAQTNHILNDTIDTVFLTSNLDYSYLSSSTVKEVASFGGDVSKFVPEYVIDKIYQKYNR
ncbi:MAG: pantetheine-phosphate adenylyltransferase [Lachnospiraceae bacterium]|nr:pantetheine-phosphate adenylyltransferase [Lachnospiraceae bacterium]